MLPFPDGSRTEVLVAKPFRAFLPPAFCRETPLGTQAVCALLMLMASGCGTTQSRDATEQLLLSDAVDRSVAAINFMPLAGQKVYFDTKYVNPVKSTNFVNSDYIVSSLRQQMVAAGCLLQENATDADIVVEARVGTLGADKHDVSYGIPASSALSTAASAIPTAPPIPVIPELSIAKRSESAAAAKVAVFAYDRNTREPVWQSGISQARSTARDVWVAGVGPFQRGTIYDGTQFAGSRLELPLAHHDDMPRHLQPIPYNGEYFFVKQGPPVPEAEEDSVVPAGGEDTASSVESQEPASSREPPPVSEETASAAKPIPPSNASAETTGKATLGETP